MPAPRQDSTSSACRAGTYRRGTFVAALTTVHANFSRVCATGVIMKREQLDRYRNQLRALTAGVQKTAATLEEQVRTPTGGEAGGGLSNAPLHLGDVGSEAYTQELSATLLENETYIRDEALAALERLDRGTYGRCEHCGQDIIPERLDALP